MVGLDCREDQLWFVQTRRGKNKNKNKKLKKKKKMGKIMKVVYKNEKKKIQVYIL